MRRILLPALLLLVCAAPAQAQVGWRNAERTVAQWYQRFLGRPMDPWARGWVDALRSGQDPNQVLSGILGSDEYFARAGNTPAGFINRLFRDVAGRNPSPAEFRHWVRQVNFRDRSDIAFAILTRHGQDWGDSNRWSDRFDYRRPSFPFR